MFSGPSGIGLGSKLALRHRVGHNGQVSGHLVELEDRNSARSDIQVMVQIKATADRFPAETDTSFHILLNPADVAYWHGGDSKVIVVCSRPRDGLVWWRFAFEVGVSRVGVRG